MVNTARHDLGKIAKVCCDIERQAMTGDLSGVQFHANGSDLSVSHPDAGEALEPSGDDGELRQHPNQNFFKVSKVTAEPTLPVFKADHGVSHQLTRAMKRHSSAPVRPADSHTLPLQDLPGDQYVLVITSTAEGINGRVLD
jgi:hypothetical protein